MNTITLFDRSLYLKGLLLLIRKDARVSPAESVLFKKLGTALGFNAGFIRDSLQEIVRNEHIADVPPVFSHQDIARRFLKDGITLSYSDRDLHSTELEWLKSVALANGLEMEAIFDQWLSEHEAGLERELEAASLRF